MRSMPNKNPAASPRAVAFDLLSFIALAVSVALASAVVLVAAVLLFASRAHAAETPGVF